jgi:GntR family transcriptional regulator
MIDPLDPTPLYRQLADTIAAKIDSGDYAAGKPLPGETRLAQEYGVAKGTVRLAMAELRHRGLIVTMPARGSYVVEH